MIAVDTNILVYAHRQDVSHHTAAQQAIQSLAEGLQPWCVPWPCLHEFLAVVTHPRIFKPPTPLDKAIYQVDCWLEAPSLVLIGEEAGYWDHLRATLASSSITGPAIHDGRIAALCLQHSVTMLWSADRDFSRFARLKVINPLLRSEAS